MSDSLQPHGLYSPCNSPGQNTGVGSLSLLQGIFLTQGSNPGPALQADSLPAEPQGTPIISWGNTIPLSWGFSLLKCSSSGKPYPKGSSLNLAIWNVSQTSLTAETFRVWVEMQHHRIWSQRTWDYGLAPALNLWVATGKSPSLSEPLFHHLQNGRVALVRGLGGTLLGKLSVMGACCRIPEGCVCCHLLGPAWFSRWATHVSFGKLPSCGHWGSS